MSSTEVSTYRLPKDFLWGFATGKYMPFALFAMPFPRIGYGNGRFPSWATRARSALPSATFQILICSLSTSSCLPD